MADALAEFAAKDRVLPQRAVEVRALHPFAVIAPVQAGVQLGGEGTHFGKIKRRHRRFPFCPR
jgi:hypothetical protein